MSEPVKVTCEEKNRRLGLALKLGVPLAAVAAFGTGQNFAPAQPAQPVAVTCEVKGVTVDKVVVQSARFKVNNVIQEK